MSEREQIPLAVALERENALRAKLEQAEQERDDWKRRCLDAEDDADFAAAKARQADKFAEALREISKFAAEGTPTFTAVPSTEAKIAREALADWEARATS